MLNIKSRIGLAGEDQARKFLINRGYKIIRQNYFARGIGEIDIIAEHIGVLVIVEVKKRINENFVAVDAITKLKRLRLAKTAQLFISQNMDKYMGWPVRFDVIAIDGHKMNLIQDAFIIY